MATGKITINSVAAARPGDRDSFLWDSEVRGFGLKVTPAGNRVYLVQYRLNGRAGKTRRVTIGNHGSPWTPDKARVEAKNILEQVRRGLDPAEQKRDRKRVAVELGFSDYLQQFTDHCLKVKWPSSWKDAESALKRYAVPVLANKPLPDIGRQQVRAVLDRAKGKVATRRYLHALLSRLFNFAIKRGDLEGKANPLADMEAPPLPEARKRVLTDDELRLAWLGSADLAAPYGPIVRLLALLGQRRDEIGGMDWAEIDRARRQWTLPGSRTKNGLEHIVPLSAPAIAEIDAVAGGEQWPKKGLVFASRAGTAPSGYSKAKAKLDAEMAKLSKKAANDLFPDTAEPWRLHDLRRTVTTGLQRLGVRFEVTEAVLNHTSGAKAGVAGVYQRHDWADEKRAALDAWASHMTDLLGGNDRSNVVAMPSRQA